MVIIMYRLYSTTFWDVLGCFTYIIIPVSDLLQSSTYLNSQRSIQRMLPLKVQSVTQTHSHHILLICFQNKQISSFSMTIYDCVAKKYDFCNSLLACNNVLPRFSTVTSTSWSQDQHRTQNTRLVCVGTSYKKETVHEEQAVHLLTLKKNWKGKEKSQY